ncbi:FHA domain-containing protein [Arenicella xantha]|uniref:FHA domain protein n=1 Tax=Arenicella xantha TaxID=644221 RepID=A0A395JN37_9GAMM|nr:FHA domain-containing protein [Arenicella xantha]RBP52887.1 FHA domain protein [Arenicella xantha]
MTIIVQKIQPHYVFLNLMAHLKYSETQDIAYLRAYHTIGRRRNQVNTCLEFDFVSKLHSLIEWKGECWMIRDMSANGTWVNGERIDSFTSYLLKKGDVIEIAGQDGVKFEFCDESPPHDMIYQVEQKLNVCSLTEDCMLPNDETPEVELYKCPERQQWFATRVGAEQGHQSELGPFEHDSELNVGGNHWRFFLGSEQSKTVVIESIKPEMSAVEFRFDISQDEESTKLTLIQGTQEQDLFERGHHYILAHLLRHKHAQLMDSIDLLDAGWMSCSDLGRDMGVDEKYLNIMIFRARKQIGQALLGYSGSAKLFERRRGAIRTGISKYSIYKGSKREI